MAEEGELKKRVCSVIWRAYMDNAEPYKIIVEPTENPANVIDDAKKDLLSDTIKVFQADEMKDYIAIRKETFVKWFGGCEESSGEVTQT